MHNKKRRAVSAQKEQQQTLAAACGGRIALHGAVIGVEARSAHALPRGAALAIAGARGGRVAQD